MLLKKLLRRQPNLYPILRIFLNGKNDQISVRTEKLIYVYGLKRSGLHAISFWLLGHEANNAFINNRPVKISGDGSRMSRTSQTSPLPVKVFRGERVACCQAGEERFIPLPAALDLAIVLFQSQHLWHLKVRKPLVPWMEAANTNRVLILRDPFNWAASYMQKSKHPDDAKVWPNQWKEYADEYIGVTNHLPNAIKINYNRWFIDKSYRQQLSAELELGFTDETLEVVTSHAGGSSFDRTNFDQQAQQMPVMERWQFFKEDERYIEVFKQRQDILEIAEEIFDLPPELAEFASRCKK